MFSLLQKQFCLVSAAVYFPRAQAIDRIFARDGSLNSRTEFASSCSALFALRLQYERCCPFFPDGRAAVAGGICLSPNCITIGSKRRSPLIRLSYIDAFIASGIFYGALLYLMVYMNGRCAAVAWARMTSVIFIIFASASA